jgi:hypothetical protein
MPIRPEKRARYPSNWTQIRAAILERAGYRCEQCKAANRTIIARGTGIDSCTYQTEDGQIWDADNGKWMGCARMQDYNAARMVEIVLTIAHLDHTPENCDPTNLRAWCQRCHLRYDAGHHAETARATRRARKAVGDLFEDRP